MSAAPRCYGVRRVSPLRGPIQVVDAGDARALSGDGVHWEIQVLAAAPEHDWRSANRNQPDLRFFRFGVWSARDGLGRVPVSPILDLDTLLGASARLVAALPDLTARLPFPLGDLHELWLTDAAGRPYALLASALEAQPRRRPEPWAATALSDHRFISASLTRHGVPTRSGPDPRHHAAELERLVRGRAGQPPRCRWLRRGEGTADGMTPPSLPLDLDWPDARGAELVRDYLDWCAPCLLTLPDLPTAERARLERAARAHPDWVEALHRLYPLVLDPGGLAAIRVEARLRRANAPASA